MEEFIIWLKNNCDYSDRTISNIVSRVRRANSFLLWNDDPMYQYQLEQEPSYQCLSSSVKSQIKKAVSLYSQYKSDVLGESNKMKVLSLYSNIGVAEAYLEENGFDVVLANELEERRAKLYKKIYPNTDMICGDINDERVFDEILRKSKDYGVNLIMATPPCQGMSTAGSLKKYDERNNLFIPVLELAKAIKPKYIFIENVPLFLNTEVYHLGEKNLIPDIIQQQIGESYEIRQYVIDTADYGIPQTRERAILLMTRRDCGIKTWTLPEKSIDRITMEDVIGDLPKLDPMIRDVDEKELLDIFPEFHKRKEQALLISQWHRPPVHIKRQVLAMRHTPTGSTAFDNPKYYPIKENGERVKGFLNTYKRQRWDMPAYTVTMDNRKISSQNNVHPGRVEFVNEKGETIYSDPRALTVYEIMKIMTLPDDWPVPLNTSEAFLRRVIGEGIPSLFTKKLFNNLK